MKRQVSKAYIFQNSNYILGHNETTYKLSLNEQLLNVQLLKVITLSLFSSSTVIVFEENDTSFSSLKLLIKLE